MARGEAMGVARSNVCGVPKGKPRQVAAVRGKASGPTGGVFGCSDHFETPVAKEEWFWLPAAKNGGWVDSGRLVGQKVVSSDLVTILRHRLRQRGGSVCQQSTNGGWVDSGRLVSPKVVSLGLWQFSDTGCTRGVVLVARGQPWRMGRQWSVGEPEGGVFGFSDHFETPVSKEEWFWLPAVDNG